MAAKKKAKSQPKKLTAVAIARDVLALMEAKKIRARTGVYFDLGSSNEAKFDGSLQAAMHNRNFKTCDVCGIGAMFMAYVDKKNEVEVHEVCDSIALSDDRALIVEKLTPYISERQLDLIEKFFENGYMGDDGIDPVINDWQGRYSTAKAMLTAICENMIANKGIFKPSMEIVVDWK